MDDVVEVEGVDDDEIQEYVYPAVPPEGIAVAEPLQTPLHVICVGVTFGLTAVG
jgi:hypothetical protein